MTEREAEPTHEPPSVPADGPVVRRTRVPPPMPDGPSIIVPVRSTIDLHAVRRRRRLIAAGAVLAVAVLATALVALRGGFSTDAVGPASADASTIASVAPVRATDAELQAGVDRALADYAAAIDAEDVDAIERVYPAITTAERGSWMGFFQDVGALHAHFTVTTLTRTSDVAADAQVGGTYAYTVASSQRAVRRTVSFVATIARRGANWQIVGFH